MDKKAYAPLEIEMVELSPCVVRTSGWDGKAFEDNEGTNTIEGEWDFFD